MRLFVAFDLPAPLKAHVEHLVDALRPRVDARWTRPEGRHVTLTFLGEVPDARLPALAATLDAVAGRHPPHALRLSGAGTFGPAAHPRVLWLGLDGDLGPAHALRADLQAALAVPDEHGGWAPHLTLARARSPQGDAVLAEVARGLADVRTAPFAVDALVLFESHGGRYAPRHTASLGGLPRVSRTPRPADG